MDRFLSAEIKSFTTTVKNLESVLAFLNKFKGEHYVKSVTCKRNPYKRCYCADDDLWVLKVTRSQ